MSSGQTVATLNQSCGGVHVFFIARLLRLRSRVQNTLTPLREDRTSIRGPGTEKQGRETRLGPPASGEPKSANEVSDVFRSLNVRAHRRPVK